MAENKKKHVTSDALEAALGVVKNRMPGLASKQKAGLVKPGTGLSVDDEGNVSVVLEDMTVNPENIADATKTQKGVVKVGDGLNVAAGVVSVDNANIDSRAQAKVDALKLKTVNGQNLRGEGDISIDLSLYKVVSSLPASGFDENKIYLVPNGETVPDGELNVYTEYIRVNGQWEKFGEFKTAIDLTPYAQKTWVNEQIQESQAATQETLDQQAEDISAIQEQISEDALKTKFPNLTADLSLKADKSYVDQNFVKASELEALCMTAADGQLLAESVFD